LFGCENVIVFPIHWSPTPLLATPKKTWQRRCAFLSFHKFWTNGAKVHEFRMIIILGNKIDLKIKLKLILEGFVRILKLSLL
jgi:hypothetical protein